MLDRFTSLSVYSYFYLLYFLYYPSCSLTGISSNQTCLFVGKITWTNFDADRHTLFIDDEEGRVHVYKEEKEKGQMIAYVNTTNFNPNGRAFMQSGSAINCS